MPWSELASPEVVAGLASPGPVLRPGGGWFSAGDRGLDEIVMFGSRVLGCPILALTAPDRLPGGDSPVMYQRERRRIYDVIFCGRKVQKYCPKLRSQFCTCGSTTFNNDG